MQSRRSWCQYVIGISLGHTYRGLQVPIVPGGTRVNEDACDIGDVTKAASDPVAVGCGIGMTYFLDGVTRLRFSSFVSSYADEVIQAVEEGLVSAWQGVEKIRREYEELTAKAQFYTQNGIGVVAGVMQIRTGVSIIGGSGGLALVPGGLMVGHGANNIYEGLGNIYRGPGAPSILGPVRYLYQAAFKEEARGDVVYYSVDLFLSSYGVFRQVQKPGVFELFRRDPVNYELAYQQSGKLALAFEALVDFITLNEIVEKGIYPRGE